MKVLSLFDGISCGRLAFERAGIPVEKYYASEIDKYAIQVAQKNYPDTIQVGDVTKLNYLELLDVDIIIGGSPCQDLSIAKQNREGLRGARSGLFWKYVEALEVIHPKYFLLENVASMRNEDRDAITETLRKLYPETECIMINSALLSAQQRKRYYWTNWHVEQPQDKGILLKDILESGMPYLDKSQSLTASYDGAVFWNSIQKKQRTMVAEPIRIGELDGLGKGQANRIYSVRGKYKRLETKDDNKANSLTSVQTDSMVLEPAVLRYERTENGKKLRKDYESHKIHHAFNEHRILRPRPDSKSNTLSTVLKDNMLAEPIRIGELNGLSKAQGNRIYSVRGKSVCLNANGGGGGAKTGLYKVDLPDGDYIIRKLTPVECERLQTLPDGWTSGVSATQRYKACGNGWTVDVIAWIFSQMPNN